MPGNIQDGRVGGLGAHLPPKTHQNYIYIWNNSHGKLEIGQRDPIQPKLQESSPCKQVGQNKRASGQNLYPREWSVGREGPHRWTLSLGSEQTEPQSGHLSPEVLCGGDKPPCLLGNPLRQTEGQEKPGLYSQKSVCMLASWQSGQRAPYTGNCHLATLPNPEGQTPWPCSLHTRARCNIWAKTWFSNTQTDWGTWDVNQVEPLRPLSAQTAWWMGSQQPLSMHAWGSTKNVHSS